MQFLNATSVHVLRRGTTTSAANLLRASAGCTRVQTNFGLFPVASYRFFSERVGGADEASHDDFQPKAKKVGTDEISTHISQWIAENDVCVFMKGTRKMPQCGFSRYVAVLLNAYGVKEYKDVNVLADENLRSAIKIYSNWPTIPQVYIKG